MSRDYFGTDGIRGPYGGPLVNEDFTRRLGAAAGRWSGGHGAALIGRDTRASGDSLAAALAEGLRSAGIETIFLGVVPTPAVARTVRLQSAALGCVVTASHNPGSDNGIKFFRSDGRKLTDEDESEVERRLTGPGANVADLVRDRPKSHDFAYDAAPLAEYISAVSGLLPPGALKGWTIALDTANGATCVTSPAVLRKLGAEVLGMGNAPDGRNINAGVGTEHPGALAEAVRTAGARIGVAQDGDGDRCVLVDERGAILDGDELLAILATHAFSANPGARKVLVATEQSNLGLDAAIAEAGGQVMRTAVGDRYVIERMAAERATLGGESSGHIVFSEISSCGDGLVAALKVIEVMLATGRPLSELRRVMRKFPQATESILVGEKKPIGSLPVLGAAIRALETELGSRGRVFVRYSGTEPKLRLLVEGPSEEIVRRGIAQLRDAIRREL